MDRTKLCPDISFFGYFRHSHNVLSILFSVNFSSVRTYFCADLSHLHVVLRILFSVNFLRYGFCAARYIIFSLPVGFIREKHLYMYGVLLPC